MKLYQNVEIEGEEVVYQNAKRKDSRFWNEGKWHTFIEPLLPRGSRADMTFVEVGCNAGLFLKMAKDCGFRHVVGIESNPFNVGYALKYRDQGGYDYKVLHRTVGDDFDFDELPVADVTLLSNVHYYFDIQTWLQYLDGLKTKTQYAIIVSRKMRGRTDGLASPQYANLRFDFRDWREVNAVHDYYGSDMKNDPSPRRMWSLLFESDLRRRDVASFEAKNLNAVGRAYVDLIHLVLDGKEFDLRQTAFYKKWGKRKAGAWTDAELLDFVTKKAELVTNIAVNGLRYPMITQLYSRIADGRTRYAIMRELGYESIMTRIL